jgi:hypothetical protein
LKEPQHPLTPNDLLHFVEMDGFWDDWQDLGLGDEELLELQLTIMAGGKNAPVIPGTGGLRKLRFAPQSWHIGKSGALRVCFAYFERYGVVLLVVTYSKSDRGDLSVSAKKRIRKLLNEAETELESQRKPR